MSSDTDYESPSDVDSFASLEMEVAHLNHRISELYCVAEELEEYLATLAKPLEGTQLAQLAQISFLASSPFRHATFTVKPPGFPGVDLTRRYPFHEICAHLRAYLVRTGAFKPDGSVVLNADLQHLFETQESEMGYVSLLAKLRAVLV